jgi:hypothetical protein
MAVIIHFLLRVGALWPTTIRVVRVLRGEQLFVGDDKEPDFRDPDARIFLSVTDFSIRGGFESEKNSRSLGWVRPPAARPAPSRRLSQSQDQVPP